MTQGHWEAGWSSMEVVEKTTCMVSGLRDTENPTHSKTSPIPNLTCSDSEILLFLISRDLNVTFISFLTH